MPSSLDIMALALLKQLTARGFPTPSIAECREILREVIDEAAEIAESIGRERAPA